jgi:hypothetical protein
MFDFREEGGEAIAYSTFTVKRISGAAAQAFPEESC